MCVCLCVCLSVCPSTRDLGNRTLYGHASFTGVKRFSWRVAQTTFRAYSTRAWFERKSVWNFSADYALSPCTHITLSGYPGQDESCPPLELRWNILEGHGYHSWYCYLHEREVDYMIKNQPVCERVITS